MIAFLVTGISRARWLHRLGTSYECITWNALNQLTAVTKNGANQATYSYDPRGRRVERIAGTTTTTWTYDAEDIVRQVTGTAIATFTHGPGIDEPMARVTGATTEYLHADGLGSITTHTTTGGAIALTNTYDAWGGVSTGTPLPYGFTAREWDANAEMYYYRARYYDSDVGRFVSADPIGFRGGLNQYAYVLDSPATKVDPAGLTPQEDPLDPKKARKGNLYYQCCYQGKMAICRGDQRPFTDSCLTKCALDHEAVHMDDMRREVGCPDAQCKDKPDGYGYGRPQRQIEKSECRAWEDTRVCIQKCASSPEKTEVERVATMNLLTCRP